ncbi:hypothetical protein [Paenibacillus agricola]|uniref:Uncharacterized protein n=1 Tax=Paenibacillus agricola TaxID=2716264 RepID=A0ABX0JC04_9BACL|nr:hypothetical protein [Paenibacillus agricola]NHN34040.1 hypothetical protein [Paenibacillus agricola]
MNMTQLKAYPDVMDKIYEMQDISTDCYRTDPELFSVIDSLVRACGLMKDSSSEAHINSQLEMAYNGLKKYKTERMSSL